MTNCWSFTTAATKTQYDNFYTLAGIAVLVHLPARQCISTHCLQDSWVHGLHDVWFHAPMLLKVDKVNFFNQWTRSSSPSMQGSYSATVNTGCGNLREAHVCTHSTLWRQHYITTNKEYVTNCHILSKYFELEFIQLHLVKISCKLVIIWTNYERKKKGAFFMKHRVVLGLIKHSLDPMLPGKLQMTLVWSQRVPAGHVITVHDAYCVMGSNTPHWMYLLGL